MKILHLTLKKQWFDLVASGKKHMEFREAKPHWEKRLIDANGQIRHFDEVHFRNGYGLDKPLVIVEWLGCVLTHSDLCHPEHGEELDGRYFVLLLGRVKEVPGGLIS
jgi:hypothetical protein